MSVDDSRIPLSDNTKTPQVYKLEIKESNYDRVQLLFLLKILNAIRSFSDFNHISFLFINSRIN